MKKQVIIITSYYPPIISVASNRIHAFAKYMDKGEFEVNVIFPYNGEVKDNDDTVNIYPIKDSSILKYCSFDKNTNFIFHKSKALWNRFLMFINVPHTGNFDKLAYKKAKEIIKPNATIISSSPYIETHIIAKKIKKNYPKTKWIADLRDPLSNNTYISLNQSYKYNKIENIILNIADAVTTVSLPIINDLEKKNIRKIPIAEVRNGYDFNSVFSSFFNEQFTIVYTGTFYSHIKPNTFFKALISLIEHNIILNFKLVFIGSISGINIPSKLNQYIEIYDKIPYNEVINVIKKADALLLILPNSQNKGVYSGKLFDYLGAMRPIIAVVDKTDVAAKLIEECNAGFIADFNAIEEIKQAVLNAYNLWKNRQTLNYNQSLIMMHHRAYQVKILEHLIKQLYNE